MVMDLERMDICYVDQPQVESLPMIESSSTFVTGESYFLLIFDAFS